MVKIEKLKKVSRSRANSLETEISWLREELKSLREILGTSEETDWLCFKLNFELLYRYFFKYACR